MSETPAASASSPSSPLGSAAATSSSRRASGESPDARSRNGRSRRSPSEIVSGSGSRPASWSEGSTRTSSTTASGLPCVISTSRWRTASGGANPATAATSSAASVSPSRSRRSSTSPGSRLTAAMTSSLPGCSRTDIRSVTGSAAIRRATKSTASIDAESHHCTSSRSRSTRPLPGGLADQRQEPERDEEPVRRLPGLEPQRDPHRGSLGLGQLGQELEQRVHELVGGGVPEVGLGLDPRGPQDPQPGLLRGSVEQRGLADPGLAAHQQGAAASLAGSGQRPVDPRPLGGATDEHPVTIWPGAMAGQRLSRAAEAGASRPPSNSPDSTASPGSYVDRHDHPDPDHLPDPGRQGRHPDPRRRLRRRPRGPP